jgi:hypothetical protein
MVEPGDLHVDIPLRKMILMRVFTLLIPFSALLLGVGCSTESSGPGMEETISREAFMETYFDLRVAALRSPGLEITIAKRDEILDARGLEEADLLNFVEVWGGDAGFMEEVWAEVRDRLREARDRGPDETNEDVRDDAR